MSRLAMSLFFLAFSARVFAVETNTIEADCRNGLKVKAVAKKTVRAFRFWENFSFSNNLPFIFSDIVIFNSTKLTLGISTRELFLASGKQHAVRGYKKTLSSDVIDFSHVYIKPSAKWSLKVYWPTTLKAGESVGQLMLECEANENK